MNLSALTVMTLMFSAGFGIVAQEVDAGKVVSKLVATSYGKSALHLVSSDGKITPFKLPAGARWGGGAMGITEDPQLSPDGTQVAYLGKASLMIRTLDGKQSTTVISGYPHEQIMMVGWAPLGGQLVYFLGPPQSEDAPASKVTEDKYFVYDLKAKSSREIPLKGDVSGWLSADELLLQDGEKGVMCSQSLKSGELPKTLFKLTNQLGQITIHPDRKRIAASSNKPNDTSSSQLVSIDLETGKETPLSKPGKWAELQWPKWSPSGNRTSWQMETSMKDGMPQSVIVVDGRTLTKPTNITDYEWLNESTLEVIELEALVVVDADSGKELNRKSLK